MSSSLVRFEKVQNRIFMKLTGGFSRTWKALGLYILNISRENLYQEDSLVSHLGDRLTGQGGSVRVWHQCDCWRHSTLYPGGDWPLTLQSDARLAAGLHQTSAVTQTAEGSYNGAVQTLHSYTTDVCKFNKLYHPTVPAQVVEVVVRKNWERITIKGKYQQLKL